MRSPRADLRRFQYAVYGALDDLCILVVAAAGLVAALLAVLLLSVAVVGLEKGSPSNWPDKVQEAVYVDVGRPCGEWGGVSAFLEQRGPDGLCSLVGFASYVARNAQAVAEYEAKQKGQDSPSEVYFHWFGFPVLVFGVGLALGGFAR